MTSLFIACFLLINLLCSHVSLADDDDIPTRKHSLFKRNVVIIEENALAMAGIQTQIVKAYKQHAEYLAYGKVVNIQPLLALRNRYLLAINEGNGVKAKFSQNEQSIKRAEALYSHGVTAKRQLQDQQAQWVSSKAQVNSLQVQSQAIVDEARLDWGDTLTHWALSSEIKPLSDFISGRKALLQISLPAGKLLPNDIADISTSPTGNRQQATIAELISPAPQSEIIGQGASYFFATNDKRLKPGMRISVWVPESHDQQNGVIIPESALLWYLDQAFVFVKTDKDKFTRRLITNYSITGNGYFVYDGLKADEQIVTSGAQLLLSEELRNQVHDED